MWHCDIIGGLCPRWVDEGNYLVSDVECANVLLLSSFPISKHTTLTVAKGTMKKAPTVYLCYE